jgi:hypothetical protein
MIESIESQIEHNKGFQEPILWNNELYEFFDSGLTRHVYISPDRTKVLKVLIDNVLDHNKKEFEIYETSQDKSQMAHTELTPFGTIEQEFCEPIKFSDKRLTLSQMKFAKSCRDEVGWNSKGELVCFDLDEFKKY